MPFNIQQFRSAMNYDGARPNLFDVTLTLPAGISNSLAFSREFTFMCRTAQLPGSSIGSVVVPYFGREVKFAGNRVFPDWAVTIINDEDFLVRNSFERWLNAINQHENNRRSPTFINSSTYSVQATVRQFGKTGFPIKTYKFVGMFPIDVSPIDLDWGANDTIEEFAVTFQYQYWLSDTTDGRA